VGAAAGRESKPSTPATAPPPATWIGNDSCSPDGFASPVGPIECTTGRPLIEFTLPMKTCDLEYLVECSRALGQKTQVIQKTTLRWLAERGI
jgi:hypothetical protein